MGEVRPIRAAPGSSAFLAIVERAVPARPGHDHSRPMCAAWSDHERRRRRVFTSTGPVFFAPWPPGSPPPDWEPLGRLGLEFDDLDFPTALAHDDPHRSEPRRPR